MGSGSRSKSFKDCYTITSSFTIFFCRTIRGGRFLLMRTLYVRSNCFSNLDMTGEIVLSIIGRIVSLQKRSFRGGGFYSNSNFEEKLFVPTTSLGGTGETVTVYGFSLNSSESEKTGVFLSISFMNLSRLSELTKLILGICYCVPVRLCGTAGYSFLILLKLTRCAIDDNFLEADDFLSLQRDAKSFGA